MAVDTVIDYPCEPKRRFGNGDLAIGTAELMSRFKAQGQVIAVLAHANKIGQDPASIRVKLVTLDAHGQEMDATEVGLADLEARAAPLDAIISDCKQCPAGANQRLCGCIGLLPDVISRTAEVWLLNRVMPPGSPGGFLLLSAIRDFHYDGEVVRGLRTAGIFEASQAEQRPLEVNPFGRDRITGDQLFHGVFGVGPKLSPWHIAMLLTWVGALAIDGDLPAKMDQFEMLTALPTTDRQRRTAARLGLPNEDLGIRQLQSFLYTLYQAWCLDVPLIVTV